MEFLEGGYRMDEPKMNLSQKELQIIEMIANEMPNKLIASKLNYSQRMVEIYINRLTKKFNVQTRVGIVSKAYKMKILNN
jgi:DNA-binding CsgD family transcriptional regulator